MREKIQILKDNVEMRIVGKGQVIDKIIICLLSDGHVLLEDVPGVGKTSIVKALSDSLSLSFPEFSVRLTRCRETSRA